jgi:hypothetical protein
MSVEAGTLGHRRAVTSLLPTPSKKAGGVSRGSLTVRA